MKKVVLLAILAMSIITQATAQKFAHANFEEIVSLMPERAEAEKKVQELQKQLESRLNSMVETYQSKTQEFQTDTTLSTTMRTSLRNEISDMEKRIQEFQQTAYTEIETKQQELMSKLFDKVRKAAVEYGKTNEYTYIFDSTSGSLLYAGGEDITPQLKTELGL
jgi:outer membrane protein